jgi:hypothetical protein
LRNHLIDLAYQFDRPDRRSREPIAHIRQYNRARAIAVADYVGRFKSNQSSRASR